MDGPTLSGDCPACYPPTVTPPTPITPPVPPRPPPRSRPSNTRRHRRRSNFASWSIYAIYFGDANILRVNAIGCGFAALYFSVLFGYTPRSQLRPLVLGTLGLAAGLGALTAGVLLAPGLSHDTRSSLLGYAAVLCNVAMYSSPIGAIRGALRSMDTRHIPLLVTLASTACSACWLLYGLLASNWFVAGPNAAGVALCVAQLGLIAYISCATRGGRGGRKPRAGSGGGEEGGGEGDGEGSEYSELDTAGLIGSSSGEVGV